MQQSINDIFFLFKSPQLVFFFCFMAGADKSTVLVLKHFKLFGKLSTLISTINYLIIHYHDHEHNVS